MAKFKDFGVGSGSAKTEPVSFKLFDEEFHCLPAIPGKILLNIVAKSGSDNPADQANVVTEFFSQVLMDESLKRFNELIVDKERIVTTETLGEVTAWLVEQYSDRPNQQPEV
jgi:hypothetical protein